MTAASAMINECRNGYMSIPASLLHNSAHLQSLWGGLLIYRIDCSFNFFEIASAHFVGKFTYTHILAIFNLVQLSYILSIALLYVLSVRQKVPKNWAVVYGIRCFLCSQIASALAAAIFFSRFTPRRSLLVAMLGVARTRFAQTSCHLFPSIARLLTVPPNAALPPLAGNYLLQ